MAIRILKFVYNVLLLTLLLSCSSKHKDSSKDQTNSSFEDICFEKYTNEKLGINIFHSKNWSPYEFGENKISLEFKDLENFQRRYDAEILIDFQINRLQKSNFREDFNLKIMKGKDN